MIALAIVGSTAAISGATESARAADLMPVKAPQAPTWDWTGAYVGAFGGYAIDADGANRGAGIGSVQEINDVSSGSAYTVTSVTSAQRLKGGFGGINAGYNWQWSHVVFGIEGDVAFSGLGKDQQNTSTENLSIASEGGTRSYSVSTALSSSYDVGTFATARARLGYAWDRYLIYVTGGAAFADTSLSTYGTVTASGELVPVSVDTTGVGSASKFVTGWVLGGGIEGFIIGNWTARLEYQYISLPSITANVNAVDLVDLGLTTTGLPATISQDASFHTLRAGVAYRF